MGIKKEIRRFYVAEAKAPCLSGKMTYRTQKHDHREDNPEGGGNVRKKDVILQRHRKMDASTEENHGGGNSRWLLHQAK